VWVVVDALLRQDMRLVATVNPTAEVTVSYPPATPACNAAPPALTAAKAIPAGTPFGLALLAGMLLLAAAIRLRRRR
jgi:hypothetical protein